MAEKEQRSQFIALLVLGIIWLFEALYDRLWISLDRSVPAWDQTNHLTGSLNYWNALQHPHWFSGEWWHSFWMLSSKYPPLTYIATAPFQQIFGTGPDQALLVNLLFSAILLGSVYGLGKHLFGTQVGLWAVGLCVLFPRLYIVRLNYLIDYPLTALVAATFCCLTVWRDAKTQRQGWLWALGFGVCLGLSMMVKQTVLFFIVVPLVWVLITQVWQRAWGKLAQLIGGLLVSIPIFWPWYLTNWLFIFSAKQNAIVIPALREGDPPLNTIAAWTYYWNDLPRAISWPLLLVPIVGMLLYDRRLLPTYRKRDKRLTKDQGLTKNALTLTDGANHTSKADHNTGAKFRWLIVFFVASYLICSANMNKDLRYIMPYLPVLAVMLAYGLASWPKRLWVVRWGTVGLAFLLMCLNLYPIGGNVGTALTGVLSPKTQNYVYVGQQWPHPQVIDEITQTTPHVKATVGVMPKTPTINHNNINYYGALQDFQVYGREVGVRKRFVNQDVRSLSWFLTQTGDEATRGEAQTRTIQNVEQNRDFQLQKTWMLPDGNLLKLYHRNPAPIEVQPIRATQTQVSLERVTVPPQTPAGVPVPVTYEWSGPWEQLKSGIVLLSWHRDRSVEEVSVETLMGKAQLVNNPSSQASTQKSQNNPKPQPANPQSNRWLHDHGIGMGQLYFGRFSAEPSPSSFRVIERMAMLPPANLAPGTYTLEATYLNRETGKHYPIPVRPVTLAIVPNAPATPAPELDLITQLRTLAAGLPKGREALDPVFDQIGRINQYDPVQDYAAQAELALDFRLQREPQNKDWAYALAFANILQRDAEGAITALQQVAQLDAQNPYAHAYLAFVYLYQGQGKNAENALKPALTLNPTSPEVKALSGAAALLQGNVVKAWEILHKLKL